MLTIDQLRAYPLAVTGTFFQATQPVSLASLPPLVAGNAAIGSVSVSNFPSSQTVSGSVNIGNWPATTAVTGTFWQSVQPVSGTFWQATQPVSGPLTDGQLRASAVPVSGTFWQATQPVSGTVGISGSVSVTGVFFQATQPVSGTFWQATQPVSIATMPSTPVTGTFFQAVQPVSAPTLTKGTQGANGLTVQDLKDSGRVIVNAATAIAGVTAVTTEALLALNVSRDGAATAGATTIAVTSGKRFRVTGMTVGFISTAAAVLSARFSLRMNPSGAVAASSPIIATLPISSGAALAQAGNEMTVSFPDGIEFSGTMQFGISQVASAATGTVWASLIGYEY